jgi:hypothetical protein
MASTEDTKQLAGVREPLDYDKGFDVIDTRTGETLAWRGSRLPDEAFRSCLEIADELNRVYPDRDEAPEHEWLVADIIGWRQTGRVG